MEGGRALVCQAFVTIMNTLNAHLQVGLRYVQRRYATAFSSEALVYETLDVKE